jgi:hypothetical protein
MVEPLYAIVVVGTQPVFEKSPVERGGRSVLTGVSGPEKKEEGVGLPRVGGAIACWIRGSR